MNRLSVMTATLLAMAAQVGAQDAPALPDLAGLPAACQDAVKTAASGSGAMPQPGKMPMMPKLGEAQQDYMAAMQKMQPPMQATHLIKDPDVSFACGMIVHHQSAIDMARAEIEYGDDPETKKLAQKMIDAQTKEQKELATLAAEHKTQ